MRDAQPTSGGGTYYSAISEAAFFQNLPGDVPDASIVENILLYFQATVDGGAEGSAYVYYSPDGSSFGDYQPQYANIAVTYPTETIDADYTTALPPGYDALLAEGNAPMHLNDRGAGNALIVGNSANDTIVGLGANDTLIGGLNGNSVIWAQSTSTVYGGGNDTIITNNGPCDVTTAATSGSEPLRSVVFLGSAQGNVVTLSGTDTLVAAAGLSSDTVTALGAATIFAQSSGLMTFNGGDAADTVVGSSGTIVMNGGTGNGSSLWCGDAAHVNYYGGAGSAYIVGGSGSLLSVQGGAGAMTVFGGTGPIRIVGSAGPSEFLVGEGAATVTAASGNLVWLAGAANDSLIASGGASTIWGAYSSGNSTFQAGSGPVLMSGGSGNDTFWAGAGAANIQAGTGADIFGAVSGRAGGAMTIFGFNPSADQVNLQGYTSYTNALIGGNEVLSLNDGTTITLEAITSLSNVTIHIG
jgi:Ca2+-binding RTX toxin-like protein